LDFDIDISSCQSTTNGMSSTNGSSKYYSTSNSILTGSNAYIPDAQNYPFSQIEYTPDNTGRIRAQGGVGSQHQLGSSHETKYYYGKPQQIELDRLFGSEVGYASHYKKNMVIDPNGQISISYLDQEGRVIATALAGDNPINVSSISSKPNSPNIIEADLLAKDANGISTQNLVNIAYTELNYYAQLLVSEPGNHIFNYGMTPMTYDSECISNICFDCIYDLKIEIRDECNSIIHNQIVTIGGPTLDKTCGEAYFSQPLESFTLNLGVGNYHVLKTLSVNKKGYEYYLKEYLDPINNSCIPNLENLIEEEKLKLDYEGCEITCEECVNDLGSMDDFTVSGKGSKEAWEELYKECIAPCENTNLCESIFTMLLADVSPGGQYAEYYDTLKNIISPSDFPLSIFNYNNVLPDGNLNSNDPNSAFWRNPYFNNGISVTPGYYEADGLTRSKILLNTLPNNQGYSPSANVTFMENGLTYCYPENLTNERDFIALWKPNWAYSLLNYHPEYCYYQWCENNLNKSISQHGLTSLQFNDKIIESETWVNANNTFGDITQMNTLLDSDPYFNAPNRSTQKTNLLARLNNYENSSLNALEVATLMILCPSHYGNNSLPNSCTDYSIATTDQKNLIWNNYKNLYISQKLFIIDDDAHQDIKNDNLCNKGVNNCIENSNFIFSNSKLSLNEFISNSNTKICEYSTYSYYVNKTRRFSMLMTLDSSLDEKAKYNRYYYGKMCPRDEDFLNFIKAIANSGNFNSVTPFPIHTFTEYTPELNKAVYEPSIIGTNYHKFEWLTNSPSINKLDITLNPTIGGFPSTNKFINLDAPTINFTTTNIVDVIKYKFSRKQLVPPPAPPSFIYLFELTVLGSDGLIHNITCQTNIEIGECEFEDDCKITDYGNSIANLISGLSINGQLNTSTAINLESNYPSLTTRFIRNNVGGTNNNLTWQMVSAGVFKIKQSGAASSSNDIDLNFLSYSPSTFNSSMINQIRYITDVRPVTNNINSNFNITAWYSASGSAPYSKVVIACSISRGKISNCYNPVSYTCDNIQLQATRDIEVLIKELISQKPTTTLNLNNMNSYTRLLESYMGKNENVELQIPIYNDNQILFEILGKNNTGDILNKTTISLYRKNFRIFYCKMAVWMILMMLGYFILTEKELIKE
jgi:hypothetical protein